MISVKSVDTWSLFGELEDRSHRELIAVTRRGHTVGYVVAGHEMQALADVMRRRQEAARWYGQYRSEVLLATMSQFASALTDESVTDMVKAVR